MTQKWSPEQISALIDAYQEEPCLYAKNTPNYHNKRLRADALNRIANAVMRLRPTVTPKECSTKFHNLRNQFNIEHSKVKFSVKSGTGTDDVYKPNLWYYEKLLFLESFVIPRKSRNSLERMVDESSALRSQCSVSHAVDENSADTDAYENIESLEEFCVTESGELDPAKENMPGSSSAVHMVSVMTPSQRVRTTISVPQKSQSSSLPRIMTSTQQHEFVVARPSVSPSSSTSSTSGICTPKRKNKCCRTDSSEELSDTVGNLLDALNKPVRVEAPIRSNETVDAIEGFLIFMGSILRTFQDEQLKIEVITNVTQTILNAKTVDLERSRSNQ